MSREARIGEAFTASCRDEIMALKPGNVHVFADGHGMTVAHFLRSAEAAASPLSAPGLSVGRRISGAVEATLAAVGMNTNLGILLLCAPLAAAALSGGVDLRAALSGILAGLDRSDAQEVFQAIAHASPGGLGEAEKYDVHEPATVTLREAMAEAAPRDRIALQYASNFEDVFVTGLTGLAAAKARGMDAAWRTVVVYLAFLAKFPDTHIARKYGPEAAETVRKEAAEVLAYFESRSKAEDSMAELLAFDTRLKAQSLNPGTSADLTVATLFADRLSSILLQPRING